MILIWQTQRERGATAREDKFDCEEFARAQPTTHARLYPYIFASNFQVLNTRRVSSLPSR